MSQYSRPLSVLVGAPVTLVGPVVVGFAAGLWAAALCAGAVWATTRLASASIVMARMTVRVFIVPLFLRLQNPEFCFFNSVLFKPAQSHQFQPGRLSEAGLLRRWSVPGA